MLLRSESFDQKQEIPRRHGKKAGNASPALRWDDAPPRTASFALAIVDRHPVAREFVHWLVTDLDPGITELPEGAGAGGTPAGSVEVSPYAGPMPPSGTHDYEVVLYALDTPHVELPGDVTFREFNAALEPHTLATATLVGSYAA